MPGCGSAGKVYFLSLDLLAKQLGLWISVATTKCAGLINPWRNFGMLFCHTCQFFYNCGRCFAGRL